MHFPFELIVSAWFQLCLLSPHATFVFAFPNFRFARCHFRLHSIRTTWITQNRIEYHGGTTAEYGTALRFLLPILQFSLFLLCTASKKTVSIIFKDFLWLSRIFFSKFKDNSRTNCTFLEFQEFSRTKVIFKDFSRSVRTLFKYTHSP